MISTECSIATTNHSRRVLTSGASRKRKERDGFESLGTLKPSISTDSAQDPAPSASNRLLAGYLAHEFLTQGTLFGQKWDPAPVTGADRGKMKEVAKNGGAQSTLVHQSYAPVVSLLKASGTHIPGIVNPTQLARWIQL